MTVCSGCGKKGLFLKLNARGLCSDCAEKANTSGQIVISAAGVNTRASYADLGHNAETDACQYFIDRLVERGKDRNLFKIDHRAADYTSLVYDEFNDFIRIKITNNVAWISIALSKEDREMYADDPLFYEQKNKNQRHWRSDFESIDQLCIYLDMAENACVSMGIGSPREATDQEKRIADYLFDLFMSCGAEPENMYYITYADEFELAYMMANTGIQFKAYAKKPGGYLRLDNYMSTVLKGEKNKYPFADLAELDCLKAEVIPYKIDQGRKEDNNNKDRLRHYDRLVDA